MKKKKVIFVSNTSWYLYNFKNKLIDDLVKNDYELFLVAPEDKFSKFFCKKNIIFKNWRLNRNSLNPLSALGSIIDLFLIYQKVKPDIVHHFTVKSCIFGSIAAKWYGVNYIINAFTGMAHFNFMREKQFLPIKWFLTELIRFIILKGKIINIFQNKDDYCKFKQLTKCKFNKSIIIPGSGVDTDFFRLNTPRKHFKNPIQILFPARLIKEKGVKELINACNLLWREGYSFQLNLAGFVDPGNNSCLNQNDLKEIAKNNNILLLGHIDHMKKLYAKCDIVVLPSWREGLSKSLIEAASMECAIITTDVPGCNDVIEHGKNGLLVPAKNVSSLKLSIQFLLDNENISKKLGQNARQKVISDFTVSKINTLTLNVYKEFVD